MQVYLYVSLRIKISTSVKKKNQARDSKIAASCVIYPLKLKRDSSATDQLVSWGRILKFPTNKKFDDGTHSQCSGTHKDHGPWVLGTHK